MFGAPFAEEVSCRLGLDIPYSAVSRSRKGELSPIR